MAELIVNLLYKRSVIRERLGKKETGLESKFAEVQLKATLHSYHDIMQIMLY